MSKRCLMLAVLAMVGVLCATACEPTVPFTVTPEPTIVDRGLAYGMPCKPPCWEQLTPGVSTAEDVRQRLERLYEGGEISSFACYSDECIADRPGLAPAGPLVFILENGMLAYINGSVGFDFEVRHLFAVLGEPGGVFLYPSYLAAAPCACDEKDLGNLAHSDYVGLVYLDQGAIFGVSVPPAQIGCVCPHMKVIAFGYFPPMASLSEYLRYREVFVDRETPSPVEQAATGYVQWHGFGPGYIWK